MRTEGLSTQVACRVLGVSESAFYDWRSRPPSARAIRHAWLTDLISQIHQQSRGTYGARRVHADSSKPANPTTNQNLPKNQPKRGNLNTETPTTPKNTILNKRSITSPPYTNTGSRPICKT